MKIRPLIKWFDMWIGVFVDTRGKRVYILPIPCVGIVVEWGP